MHGDGDSHNHHVNIKWRLHNIVFPFASSIEQYSREFCLIGS